MKKSKLLLLVIAFVILLLTTSCSLKKDDLEGATIYTTVYPIRYLTEYLYKSHSNISSIYPADCNINDYKLTKKQINTYSKGKLFIYNGLSAEKEYAKEFINNNSKLLIIDASYGLTLNNDVTELWLSPNNYLMLAKNIKENLKEYSTSKVTKEELDKKFDEFEEKVSLLDATLHTLGNTAKENNKTLVVANKTFKYLENYGFKVLCLEDDSYQKETKIESLKKDFKNKTYKSILVLNGYESDLLITLKDAGATTVSVDDLTLTLKNNYFDLMNSYIENIRKIVTD